MAVRDEDRAVIADLTLEAFDATEEFGEDVRVEDAVVLIEISYPNPEDPDERLCELVSRTTTHRATVAGGMAQAYANTQINDFIDADDLD